MPRLTLSAAPKGTMVTEAHFGSNYLADREVRHNHGIEGALLHKSREGFIS